MADTKATLPNRRQAHQTLAAFRFQLLQTTKAWLDLSPGQLLLVEHIEDFDIASSDGDVAATQVKFSGSERSITLAGSETTDALSKFWEANASSSNVKLVVQTNLKIGKERDLSFADGKPGILYWEDVRHGAPTTPIQAALLQTLPAGALKTWLESNPSDDDVRELLIRRVFWSTGAESGPELAASLSEQLAGRLLGLGISTGLASNLSRQLLDHVFEQASEKDPELRKLDSQGLNTFLIHASSSGSATAPLTLPSWCALTSDVGLPRPCAPRQAYITDARRALDTADAIWIHGASGCGKSTVAQQIAALSDRPWLLVEFRELKQKRETLLRLSRTYSDVVAAGTIAGIILDDIDGDVVSDSASRFARFVRWAGAKGLKVSFTSARQCSAATGALLGIARPAIVEAAYLEQTDTEFLVRELGAPADEVRTWSFFAHAVCGGGHPQLVAAKLNSLAWRGWPPEALKEDFIAGPSEAIVVTKAEARRRLVSDASDAGRALLKRLACVHGKFDRNMAINAASVDPGISDASASLDFLIGPWIEKAPGSDKYFRLSPLLAGLQEDVPTEEATATRVQVAVTVLSRGPMGLEEVSIVFWNSFVARHGWLLMTLHQSFLGLSEEAFRLVAQELSPITFFRTDIPFVDGDPITSITLRILQIDVAAATDNQDVFQTSVAASLRESEDLKEEELRVNFLTMTLMKALFASGMRVDWRTRFGWIDRYEELSAHFPHLASEADSPMLRQIREDLGPDASPAGFFVTIGAQTIQSVGDLEDLFAALGEMPRDLRDRRLRGLKSVHRDYGIYIQQGWAASWFEGQLEPDRVVEGYARLYAIADSWGDRDLAAECLVAQAVLLDEHLKRAVDALSLVDAALAADDDNFILLRQKAKLLGHLGRYSEASDLHEQIRPALEGRMSVDQMYALKESAVAAGSIGNLQKAADLFLEAASKVETDDDPKLKCHRVSLTAEAALCWWKNHDHKRALVALAAILEQLQTIDPDSTDIAFMLHARVRFAIGYIEMDTSRPLRMPPILQVGAISALDIDMSKMDRTDRGPLADVQYMLHIVAVRLGVADAVNPPPSDKVTRDFEFLLRAAELSVALERHDSADIAGALRRLVDSMSAMRARLGGASSMGTEAGVGVPGVRAMMAGIAMHACALNRFDHQWWDKTVDACTSEFGLSASDLNDLKTDGLRPATSSDVAFELISGIGARDPERQTPQEKFAFHLLCVQAAMAAAPAYDVVRALIRLVRDDWTWIFDRQRFLLSAPERGLGMFQEAGQRVDRVEAGGLTLLMTMAALVLRQSFDASWIATFERLGGPAEKERWLISPT